MGSIETYKSSFIKHGLSKRRLFLQLAQFKKQLKNLYEQQET